MTFLSFGHAQKNAFAFLIALPFRQIAIRLCGLDFLLPVVLCNLDRFLGILLLGGHAELKRNETCFPTCRDRLSKTVRRLLQSAGSSAGLKAGATRARSCWAVMISATEPMMRAAAINVRTVTVSPAKKVPSKTATIGFTYA